MLFGASEQQEPHGREQFQVVREQVGISASYKGTHLIYLESQVAQKNRLPYPIDTK